MRLIVILAALLLWAAPAQAKEFAVDTTADAHDNTTADGFCQTAAGACSLRAAVEQANQLAGPDVIRVPVGDFAYTTVGAPTISTDITLIGAGARETVIDGPDDEPALVVIASGTLTVSDLALTKARYGLYVNGGTVDAARVAIRDNTEAVPNPYGAGLTVLGGTVTMRDAVISGNAATGGDGGDAQGGGIYTDTEATVTLRRTTVANNRATSSGVGSSAYGGGIVSFGTIDLHHVTLTGNQATAGTGATGGGNLYTGGQPVALEDSIIAGGVAAFGPNCGGSAPVTLGRNLDSGTSCGFGAGQLSDADPQLEPLGDHSGPTDTLTPRLGSPALDAAAGCGPDPQTDQRLAPVPAGPACDIGAAELGANRGVKLTQSADTVAPGGTVTLVATAINGGPDPTGATVALELPAGGSAELVTPSAGSCSGTTCDLGILASGATATVTVALRLPAAEGPATTTARVTGPLPDPEAAGDTATVTTTVAGAGSTLPPPPPGADTTAPALTDVRVAKRLKAKRRGTLAFTLSEAATVRVKVSRRVRGRRRVLGSTKRRAAAGPGTLRIPKRLVRRGRLRLTVTATDAAGNRSKPVVLGVRGRK